MEEGRRFGGRTEIGKLILLLLKIEISINHHPMLCPRLPLLFPISTGFYILELLLSPHLIHPSIPHNLQSASSSLTAGKSDSTTECGVIEFPRTDSTSSSLLILLHSQGQPWWRNSRKLLRYHYKHVIHFVRPHIPVQIVDITDRSFVPLTDYHSRTWCWRWDCTGWNYVWQWTSVFITALCHRIGITAHRRSTSIRDEYQRR